MSSVFGLYKIRTFSISFSLAVLIVFVSYLSLALISFLNGYPFKLARLTLFGVTEHVGEEGLHERG